jgi:hypothetical protein
MVINQQFSVSISYDQSSRQENRVTYPGIRFGLPAVAGGISMSTGFYYGVSHPSGSIFEWAYKRVSLLDVV